MTEPDSDPGRPETLVLHTVAATHWMDAEELEATLERQVPEAAVRVARTPPESAAMIETAEVVLAAQLPGDLLDRARSLEWIQALSAGVDFYDVERLREAGIVLTNAAGIHAEPVAEQVIGYLLAFERKLKRGIDQQRRGVWERYEGGELRGKTLGIVGVGAIGSRVAELGGAFGMRVVGTKRDPADAPAAVDECWAPDGLYDLLTASDYVVVACPLTGETRGLLGAEELGAMRDSAVLVNVARGEIADQDALVEALQQRVIRGAALDVFAAEPLGESPLWDLSNAIVTPHMAGSTPRKHERIADIFAENYEAFVAGETDAMVNRVV